MPKLSKQEEREVEVYSTGMLNLLYDKKTSGPIYEILKSGDPQKTVPQAALLINEKMEQAVSSKGQPPSQTVVFNAGLILIKELIDVGHAGGFFQIEKQDVQGLMSDTMKEYIHQGIKKGTIDPVELQATVEPYMDGQSREVALAAGQQTGVPTEVGVDHAMEVYANKKVQAERSKMTQQAEAKGQFEKMQQRKQSIMQQKGGR